MNRYAVLSVLVLLLGGCAVDPLEDRRTAARPSFEAMKPEIAEFMTFQEIQNLLTRLRTSSDIQRSDIKVEDPPVIEDQPDEEDDI